MTLRVVKDETPPQRKPAQKSVTQAAKNGTPRELLVAMRDRIAVAVEDEKTSPRDLAALTRRLAEVVRDIEQIDAREEQEAASAAGEAADEAFDSSTV